MWGTRDRAAALYSVASGGPQTHDAVLRIGSELRGGGPILPNGIGSHGCYGPRHLEPSSATPSQALRTGPKLSEVCKSSLNY